MNLMSASNELTRKIIEYIFKHDGFSWRSSSTGIPTAQGWRSAPKIGTSDILGVYKGKILAIEIKIGKDKLRPEQDGFLQNIAHYGGLTFIAKDFDSFVNFWHNTVKGG